MESRSCPHTLPSHLSSLSSPVCAMQVMAAWGGLGDTDRLWKGQWSPCSPAHFWETHLEKGVCTAQGLSPSVWMQGQNTCSPPLPCLP